MALNVFGLAVVRDAATIVDFFTDVIAGSAAASPGTVNDYGGATAVVGGAYALDDSDYSHDFARDDVETTLGALATVLVKRQIEKITIQLVPFATHLTGAAGVPGMAILPAPMSVITLSGSTVGLYDGTWNYVTGSKIKSKKASVLMITMNLERYDGAALAQATDGS